MNRVKVGVIGLGEVAQVIHLPILQQLRERYEVRAVCDISRTLLREIGDLYGVDARYADARALCEHPDLDAVLVLNSDEYHAECAVAAARAGKHVFIEKPMCLTLREAEEIVSARDEAGVEVFVGYMRRYAPAFERAVEEVRELGPIHYARVRDIIGPNRSFIDQSSVVLRPGDLPPEAVAERRERGALLVADAIGEDAARELAGAYRFLGGLSSHDLSAMRELLGGPPRRVVAATLSPRGYISALFAYDGFTVGFETGVNQQLVFDAHLEVYGETRSLRVQYDTPYIRHLPTTLELRRTEGGAYTTELIRPTYTDPYTVELERFHETVTRGVRPKTTPEDAMEDLRLSAAIVEAIRRGGE